ncbi:MAG: Type restriction-modification system, restriction subunit [Acidobacteriaceae bacterium]|nr:Type restriction-modification system, restriction subunit [Acidobacteriaceae bacterium]
MTNFGFLQSEWPELCADAEKSEGLVIPDPRTSCFYARRTLEQAITWLYKSDPSFKLPYQDNLSALIHEPTFKATVGQKIFVKAKLIKDLGNLAAHSHKQLGQSDSMVAVRELFHVCFWLARTYSKTRKPADGLAFDSTLLPKTSSVPPQTLTQLQQLESQLAEKDTQLTELLTGKAALDAELERLRAEIAEIKKQNEATPDTHNYSEAETRDYFIDLLLKEAGWPLDKQQDREYPVAGMPNEEGEGFVDYVLWGDDGKPLGLVEAKRTKRDARVGQQQAKLYADCLEKKFGQRPVIFYSNGYEHWIWDDQNYPPREVQGFYKKDELERLIQRRSTRSSLGSEEVDKKIVERFYQERAIRRIADAFEKDHERKALVVMATGAGKTRTVAALCDLMMRCNWVKRVLFLADRIALVKQTTNVFKKFLPSAAAVNVLEHPEQIAEARVLVSTYPTMLRLIDETKDDKRKFGPGHFDLVIIDEAHRSVYQKYRAIFEYFDSFLVGLTATPKDEVDHNTYGLFDLEDGVPTDAYGLEEAVKDGFLVPPRSVSVPMKFQREGISYKDLTDEEKERWDAIEWDEDGSVPGTIEPEALNRWLFNEDTGDKVLEHLMRKGEKVADGDRLGKTIIFAKNHAHAQFVADRFDANYPQYKGSFARVIDFKVEYAQSLIDDFSNPARAPHIAISVDMLDTGIDIPEVVNLVFFKMVRSKTKFWQMVGRGTRLRPDLFGPGRNKKCFYIFDYCQNLEFFSQNPETTSGSANESLSKKLFASRVELIGELDKRQSAAGKPELRSEVAERLRQEVERMNVNNFIVRPKRKLVEKYGDRKAWQSLDDEQKSELIAEVAGLPSELIDDDQEAKQFDLLILRLQLGLLRHEKSFTRWSEDVREIAGALEEKASIPMVREQLELIIEVQTDEFWQDITTPMLEDVRKRLRSLVKFVERTGRTNIYTDFLDLMGEEREIDLPGFDSGHDVERFRDKTQRFLKAHEDDPVIHKLRWNEPLTREDLDRLEKMMAQAGAESTDGLKKVRSNGQLGLFVRSLVGLDREAAKRAFAGFLDGKKLTANQIQFVNLVIDYLTHAGWMSAAQLYETPFTDYSPRGVDGVFNSDQVSQLIGILNEIRARAAA